MAKYIRELFSLIGIKQNPSTAFHPQTDGQTEWINQSVEQYLRIFINHHQNDWKDWLPLAEFALNDSVHSATGATPFYINTGQHPWKGQDTRRETRNDLAGSFADKMKCIRLDAEAALRQAAERMKASHDRRARTEREFAVGDQVYLEATNLRSDRPSKKLDDKRFGPFKIKQKVGAASYKLHLPASWPAIHPTFHESLLTHYRPPRFPSQQKPPPPPPLEVEGELQYNVEAIRDSRRRRGKLEYLVHWEGYPREEDSWEPAKHVTKAPELVEEFHRQNPQRPSPTNNIRVVEVDHPLLDPKLYNEYTNTLGKGFVPLVPRTCSDVILPLSSELVDDLVYSHLLPSSLLARVPSGTKRLWIYETRLVDAVTFTLRLNTNTQPLRLYQLLDPLTARTFHKKYDTLPPRQLSFSPPWLLRDYSKRLLSIW